MSALPALDEQADTPESGTLKGVLADVRYHNPLTHFASLEVLEASGRVHRACGTINSPIIGEQITLFGDFSRHSNAGRVFVFERFETRPPEGVEAQVQYLCNATGLTERMARAVLARFGVDTTTILERSPERLLEVGGLSAEMVEAARGRWMGSRRVEQASSILTEFGITEAQLGLLRRQIGDGDTLFARLRENPYLLYMHLSGIGWRRIDSLAQRFKIPTNHPSRIEAGFLCLLRAAAVKGHTYLPVEDLLLTLPRLLGVEVIRDSEPFEGAVRGLSDKGLAVLTDTGALCLTDLYAAENTLTTSIRMLEEGEREFDTHINPDRLFKLLDADLGGVPEALLAPVRMALDYKVCVLDMPDNALRLQLIRALHHLFGLLGGEVRLVSSGAGYLNRLRNLDLDACSASELIGRIPFGPPKHTRNLPLELDLLIVERAESMGVREMAQLFDALPSSASVVLLGDGFELPPQGPGCPFVDLVGGAQLPVHTLAPSPPDGALLAQMRAALRQNASPSIPCEAEPHAALTHLPLPLDVQVAHAAMVQFHHHLFPSLRLSPFEEVAVYAIGSPSQLTELNHRLRDTLNGAGTPIKGLKSDLREGDWVVFTDTLLDHHIGAGTRARIVALHPGPKVRLQFMDGSHLVLHAGQCKALRLGYVCVLRPDLGTPHKATVLLLLDESPDNLTRQALYQSTTATGRLIIVGDKALLDRCLSQSLPARLTRLDSLMRTMKD